MSAAHPEALPHRLLRLARRRYTQRELAAVLSYSPRQISRWETGKAPIPPALVPALREAAFFSPPFARSTPGDFTFIDLFAGIGGIRLGFESIGGMCVFSSEWDPHAQRTYVANFGNRHPIAGDIRSVPTEAIPDHDVLLAGFPCQPFSIAGVSKKNALGRPHGFRCTTQGTLFFEVARIISEKRPFAFLLENVKNLVSHDRGRTFRIILETLRDELGYHVTWRVIDARHFVPQHRERILIVGFREATKFDWDALPLPDGTADGPRMKDILHPEDGTELDVDGGHYIDARGRVLPKYILSERLWRYLREYAAKHRAKGNGFGYGLVGPDDVARTLSARYYKDGSEILVDRGPRRRPRRLTPRECARLMGFPDSFRIVVSDTQAYKQFGNSVAVPVIRHVARLMRPHLPRRRYPEHQYPAQQMLALG